MCLFSQGARPNYQSSIKPLQYSKRPTVSAAHEEIAAGQIETFLSQVDEKDFEQPRALWEKVFDDSAKERFINNVSGHIGGCKSKEIIKRQLSKFSGERIGPLFNGWRLGVTTVCLWFIWAFIGMGYPLFNAYLPQYLQNSGGGEELSTDTTYRNYAIVSICGVPGSAIAWFTVNWKYVGRKGTMAIGTLLSGIFLILFTQGTNSGYQLAMSWYVSPLPFPLSLPFLPFLLPPKL